jgi:hypothetical protein
MRDRQQFRAAVSMALKHFGKTVTGEAAYNVLIAYAQMCTHGYPVKAGRIPRRVFPLALPRLAAELDELMVISEYLIQNSKCELSRRALFEVKVDSLMIRLHNFHVAWQLAIDLYNLLSREERDAMQPLFVKLTQGVPQLSNKLSTQEATGVLAIGSHTLWAIRARLPYNCTARTWWYLRDAGPVADAVATQLSYKV